MLTHIHVLQARHTSNNKPMVVGLLKVGKPNNNFPVAWVDTIVRPDRLNVTPVPRDKDIEKADITAAILTLTNGQQGQQAFLEYLWDLGEEELGRREKWYTQYSRQYKSTHYAGMDAAIACRPNFSLPRVLDGLEDCRKGIQSTNNPAADLFEPDDNEHLVKQLKDFQWEDFNYPAVNDAIYKLIRRCIDSRTTFPLSLVEEMVPLTYLHFYNMPPKINIAFADADKRRLRTPKSRLLYMLDLVQNKRMQLNQRTTFFKDVKSPLDDIAALDFAKLPPGEQLQLICDYETYMSKHFLVNTDYFKPKANPAAWENAITIACSYKVVDDKIVYDKPLATTYREFLERKVEYTEGVKQLGGFSRESAIKLLNKEDGE